MRQSSKARKKKLAPKSAVSGCLAMSLGGLVVILCVVLITWAAMWILKAA